MDGQGPYMISSRAAGAIAAVAVVVASAKVGEAGAPERKRQESSTCTECATAGEVRPNQFTKSAVSSREWNYSCLRCLDARARFRFRSVNATHGRGAESDPSEGHPGFAVEGTTAVG